MKTCTKCKETKALDEFGKASWGKDGKNSRCLKCHNEANKKWVKDNPTKVKEYSRQYYQDNKDTIWDTKLQKQYGITKNEYDTMFIEQGCKCASCGSATNRGHPDIAFPVDHCHTTGKVRGVLCSNCNRSLGLMEDNPEYLKNLRQYLLDNTS